MPRWFIASIVLLWAVASGCVSGELPAAAPADLCVEYARTYSTCRGADVAAGPANAHAAAAKWAMWQQSAAGPRGRALMQGRCAQLLTGLRREGACEARLASAASSTSP